ncbi:MAG: protein translocase subunit SecD [Chloroflexi bacterium]|nr:protein translocase subunit SecD [Chloroflexota bacterium]
MPRKTAYWLVAILILTAAAIWVDLPTNPGLSFLGINREIKVHEGLDLQGGIQVLLEAKPPAGTTVSSEAMSAAKSIVEQRVNGLGVSEPVIQQQGSNRIIVELPGIKDPDQAISTFHETGLLEFVDSGRTYLPEGTVVQTTFSQSQAPSSPPAGSGTPSPSAPATTPPTASSSPTNTTAPATPSPSGSVSPSTNASGVTNTQSVTPTAPVTSTAPITTTPQAQQQVYRTILTGKDVASADVTFDDLQRPMVSFTLTDEGGKKFGEYTSQSIGNFLSITMDKKVVSSATIKAAIQKSGVIEGVNLNEAKKIVVQLKYGSLPVPLEVVQDRTVGPTLGQDSVAKSIDAGLIGLGIVALFMVLYYRLPGVLADVSLGIYTVLVFALFKLVPVTLTLAGIAGFILSIGMAVDANVLIFARVKEELRQGKTLGSAVEAGFKHAWPSIRDSNISTMITCIILFWFGSTFGASIIKGFALTLGIGVAVSMFTAITVTRTFMRVLQSSITGGVMQVSQRRLLWLYGLSGGPKASDATE